MMKRLAIVLILICTSVPAQAEESFLGLGANSTGSLGVAMEIDRLAMLLGDENLRDLVCRLSSERYTFGGLSSALGIPEGQVMRRINTLRGWGLVRLARQGSASTIVEPMPGEGARTLRRWADRYCPTGDNCGRPTVNPAARPEGRERTASGPGGVGLTGGLDARLRDKLVTVFGGAGFLGSDLVMHLLAAGARVRIASRNPGAVVVPESSTG